MNNLPAQKKPVVCDWTSHYIVYRLRERGQSLRRLARLNGYCATGGSVVMFRAWPNMEQLIATAIGVTPQEIWPSRYHSDGTPKFGRQNAQPAKSIRGERGTASLGRAA